MLIMVLLTKIYLWKYKKAIVWFLFQKHLVANVFSLQMDPLSICVPFVYVWFHSPFLECEGLAANEVVDENTINRFRGCGVVTSGGVYIASVTNFKWVVILNMQNAPVATV